MVNVSAVPHAEVVLGLGVIVALVYPMAERGTRSRRMAWPAVGAPLPFALLLLYHAQVFGSPLRTGYTASDEAAAFGLEYERRNWLGYFRTLMTEAGPLTVLGTPGIAAMIAWEDERQRGLLLLTSSLALLAVYLAYYWTLQDFRSLLPIVPLLILAACDVRGQGDGRGNAECGSCGAARGTWRWPFRTPSHGCAARGPTWRAPKPRLPLWSEPSRRAAS